MFFRNGNNYRKQLKELYMKNPTNNFLRFLRKNAVYFILGLCLIAIGLSVTLVLLNGKDKVEIDNPVTPPVVDVVTPPILDEPTVNPDPIIPEPPTPADPVIQEKTYVLPVGDATSVTEYGDTMVYNSTLKRFTAHLAVDFFAPEGTPVYAVSDGTVESVETTLLGGTTVVIDHGDGLKTVYNSLSNGDCVVAGQWVKGGAKIGEVSLSNKQEYKDGAHLHFEMIENGEKIDPAKYLTFSLK